MLTTEQQTDLYAATMEAAAAAKEDALFSNVTATSVNKPAGFTSNTNNAKVSKLNGAIGTAGNKRVGPSIVLKVMAWDTISLSVLAWYSGTVQPPATGVSAIATDLLPLLTSGITAGGGTKGGAIPTGTSGPLLSSSLTSFLTNNQPYTPSNLKAFLNWMVVVEEFAGVSSPNHMKTLQVPTFNAGDTNKQMVGLNRLVIRRNGWIYVYLSNESSQDVFFDNLVVNLTHGPLVEQKDYYPFGLEIPGLSTKALKPNYYENRNKFNGIEYDTAFGLDEYEAHYRDLDPQIGRWTTIDPSPNESESPYASMGNNPISKIDPLGDSSAIGDWLDRHGYGFHPATSEEVANHPVKAAIDNAGYGLAQWFGLAKVEQAARTSTDTKASTIDKVGDIAGAFLATAFHEEEGEGKMLEKPVTEKPVANIENPQTNFVVSEKGTTVVIPKGATGPTAPEKGTGMAYKNGSGGHGMDKKVTGVRIMDANGSQPSRVNYMNEKGQTVAPETGQTIPNSDQRGHIPFQ